MSYYRSEDELVNYEEEEAQSWRQPTHQQNQRTGEPDPYLDRTNRMPDEVWLIPPQISSVIDILGEKKANLQRIEKSTNTHMIHNEKDSQIEMWGKREDIEQAIKQWNTLAENVLSKEQLKNSKRKTKGWAKPDKFLNEKQQRKKDRREAREREEKDYLGIPPENKPFNGHFVLPNSDIPISRIIGEKTEVLNSLRADTKCYIWHDPTTNVIKVVGDSYASVEEATTRVKNLYIKVLSSRQIPHLIVNKATVYKGWVHHLIEPPHGHYKIKIAKPPSWLHLPYDVSGEVRLLEPVFQGERISVVGKEEALREIKRNSNFDDLLENIRKTNIETIKNTLFKALSTIHLFDDEAKMRVRFGHVCLTDFPRDELWPIDKFNDRVLKDSRLQSKFASCVTTERTHLNPLLEALSAGIKKRSDQGRDDDQDSDRDSDQDSDQGEYDDQEEDQSLDYHELFSIGDKKSEKKRPKRKYKFNPEWEGSPFREFKIGATRTIKRVPWPCAFEVQFKKDGKIGLWNATIEEKNVLDINMSCLDNPYSWKLNIKTAKRLSNDKFSAQGNFVYKLRICPQNRLVYSNTDEITVDSVCEKTKWKYWWDENTVIEVTRYEFWNLQKSTTNHDPGIEVFLDRESAPIVSFGISLYKKSWDDSFAFNSNLDVGEAPEWHPYDIVDEGSVKALIGEIQDFLEVLQRNLPNNE